MPSYSYICRCGYTDVVIRPMSQREQHTLCPNCSGTMQRDYRSDSARVGVKEYAKPLVSSSLAIHPEQIPEHNKHFPNIEVQQDGCPVFHNTKEHSDYLRKIGWDKDPPKRKMRGKRLNIK